MCIQTRVVAPDLSDRPRYHFQEHQVATAWTLLKRFGYEDVYNELKANTSKMKPHRLDNIMTLDSIIHDRFDRMRLWLEADSEVRVSLDEPL